MKRFNAHEIAEPGLYLNLRQLRFQMVEEPRELEGRDGERFSRVPTLALLLFGPVIGLAYLIFLPLIGFVALGWLGGTKGAELVARARRRAAERRVRAALAQPGLAWERRSRSSEPAEGSDGPVQQAPTEPSGSHDSGRRAA